MLPALESRALDPALLAGAGPWLRTRLLVLPAGCEPDAVLPPDALAPGSVMSRVDLDGVAHLLVAARPEALLALTQAVSTVKGRAYEVPDWLQADPAHNRALLAERRGALARAIAAGQATLAALGERHGLARALGDANRLHWVMQNVHALEAGELLCWITGWSSDADGATLSQALEASGTRAILRFAAPPQGTQAPLLLANPAWARPFEIFGRAMGAPAAGDVDASPLLAFVVPLMFGYMFADLGQGLVLAAAGWWYRRRYPLARLLMVGGCAAAAFGLLFGSVFSLHGALLPALWVQPLEAPLAVLFVPLVGGGVLLTAGLALNGLAAHWRGEWRRWLLTDAAFIVLYLALLAAPVVPGALRVAGAAALYFCLGHAVMARSAAAAFGALGELLEKSLQILINTLSFARVGAFALAHAGLSSALFALLEATDSLAGKAVLLIAGNLLIMVIEVLVVSIQTTRLVLFEFFTRFVQGEGRAFRPLPAPPFG